MKWRCHVDGSPAHVWPELDVIEHELEGEGCPCGPTIEPVPREDGSMGWLITHHELVP